MRSLHTELMCAGVQKSPLAGNFISNQIRLIFEKSEPPVPLTPHYMVASKVPVDAGAPSQATYRKFDVPPTASFRRFQEERVLTEFKESVVQLWTGPGRLNNGTNEEIAKSQPPRPFEMPDGWNQVFGVERFKPAEALFDAKAALTVSLLLLAAIIHYNFSKNNIDACALECRTQTTPGPKTAKPFR
jgi:actin-related protein 4